MEVPKACFSSAAFGARAQPQIAGVLEGDEIVLINGERPSALAARITKLDDPLSTCGSASPPHKPGAMGKLAASPCISCDFMRRWRTLGLDVALQMWIRAVKQNTPVVLGVRHCTPCASAGSAAAAATASPKRPLPSQPDAAAPSAKRSSNEGSTANALSSTSNPPTAKKATGGVYNPLKPAASAASAVEVRPKAKAKAAVGPRSTVAGFTCEERTVGSGGDVAKVGQKVLFKFQLRLAKDEKKGVLERGEVSCRLGDSEVLDGWVDGNVDLEEVLSAWGRSLAGMRPGGSRRVFIPAKRGFRGHGGGDVAAQGSELIFDVDLKKLQ